MDKKSYEVDKDECNAEMLKSKSRGQMTEKLGVMVIKICDGLQLTYPYESEEIKNDVRSVAITIACEKWNIFDPNREESNAFSYLTSMIHNGIKEGMNIHTKATKNCYRIDTIFDDNL